MKLSFPEFATWYWVGLLLFVPILIWVAIRDRQRAKSLVAQLVSSRLAVRLVGKDHQGRRWWKFSWMLGGIVLAVFALMRPQLGFVELPVEREGKNILIGIDTSRSMLAEDVKPNRITRTGLAIEDLLKIVAEDRVGVIAFAGAAFLQAPLTIDHGAVRHALQAVDTDIIPVGGTNLAQAIKIGTQAFERVESGSNAIILFTDGEELDDNALREAKAAGEAGVRIFTIGVGTVNGARIPEFQNGREGWVRDNTGRIVVSKLDEERLRDIANATGGQYFRLEATGTLDQLWKQGLSSIEDETISVKAKRTPLEHYQWPLGAAVVCLLIAMFTPERPRKTQR